MLRWDSWSTVSQAFEQWVLQGLSSCDPGGRVQVQQPVQQVVSLIRNSVPAPLIFLHLAVCLWAPWMFLVIWESGRERWRSFTCSIFVFLECSFSGTMCGSIILDLVKMGGGGVFVGFRKWCGFVIWWRPPSSQRVTQRPEVLPRQLPTAHHCLTWVKFNHKTFINYLQSPFFYYIVTVVINCVAGLIAIQKQRDRFVEYKTLIHTKCFGSLDGLSGASNGHDLSEGDQVIAGFEERVTATEQREQDHTSGPHVYGCSTGR